jgi:carboxyl-terminal processing protease
MSASKRMGSVLLTLLFVLCSFYQPAQGSKNGPEDIYKQAWKLVRDNYYDSSFGGQNWNAWEHKYDGQLKSEEEAFKAIRVMLESLKDPYTRFLDPRAFQDENDAIDARIVGIGINLQENKDKTHLVVIKTIEDSPAALAGVQGGDEIQAIDGASALGLTPEQAAEKIRGKAGTAVNLTVRHKNESKDSTFKIVRAEIIIKAVRAKRLENNIGYIELSTFISNDASREFREALAQLSNTDGLIIDLRDNPGGLLSNALEIADMLLIDGPIVTTIGRGPMPKHVDMASGAPLTHQPIVVLVDEDSASASEILAGALKDHNRAIVVGNRTYGKGLVQEINRLNSSKAAVHITVSKYLTPNGTDINKVGINPDVLVTGKNEQLAAAVSTMKQKIASLRNNRQPGASVQGLQTSSLMLSK